MEVRWGTTISTQFTVANGVKQGGIISPILFNMYMDDLSIALNNSGIGVPLWCGVRIAPLPFPRYVVRGD